MRQVTSPEVTSDVTRALCNLQDLIGFSLSSEELAEGPPWEGGWSLVTKQGKLVNRISRYLKKKHGFNMSGEVKSMLGNMFSEHIIDGQWYNTDRQLEPEPGKFMDGNSCFYGGRRQAWAALKKMGGFMLQAYDQDGVTGIGRSLVVPDRARQGHWVINTYGRLSLPQHSMLLCLELGMMGRAVAIQTNLSIDGSYSEPIYINQQRGVFLTDAENALQIRQEAEQTTRFNVVTDYNGRNLCQLCGDPLIRVWQPESDYGQEDRWRGWVYLCDDCMEPAREKRENGEPFWQTAFARGEKPKRRLTIGSGISFTNSTSSSITYDDQFMYRVRFTGA